MKFSRKETLLIAVSCQYQLLSPLSLVHCLILLADGHVDVMASRLIPVCWQNQLLFPFLIALLVFLLQIVTLRPTMPSDFFPWNLKNWAFISKPWCIHYFSLLMVTLVAIFSVYGLFPFEDGHFDDFFSIEISLTVPSKSEFCSSAQNLLAFPGLGSWPSTSSPALHSAAMSGVRECCGLGSFEET